MDGNKQDLAGFSSFPRSFHGVEIPFEGRLVGRRFHQVFFIGIEEAFLVDSGGDDFAGLFYFEGQFFCFIGFNSYCCFGEAIGSVVG